MVVGPFQNSWIENFFKARFRRSPRVGDQDKVEHLAKEVPMKNALAIERAAADNRWEELFATEEFDRMLKEMIAEALRETQLAWPILIKCALVNCVPNESFP